MPTGLPRTRAKARSVHGERDDGELDRPCRASGRRDLRARAAAMFLLKAERATRDEDMAGVVDGGKDDRRALWRRSVVANRGAQFLPFDAVRSFVRSSSK